MLLQHCGAFSGPTECLMGACGNDSREWLGVLGALFSVKGSTFAQLQDASNANGQRFQLSYFQTVIVFCRMG